MLVATNLCLVASDIFDWKAHNIDTILLVAFITSPEKGQHVQKLHLPSCGVVTVTSELNGPGLTVNAAMEQL